MHCAKTKALNLIAHEVIQLGMVVTADAGRDDANPADTRVHKYEKRSDGESGACVQEKLKKNGC